MLSKDIPITNKLGLHARAAAKFVALASTFNSEINVSRNGRNVNGKSIMGVMMLAAACGSEIHVEISGEDEARAMAELKALVQNRFGEEA